MVIRKATHLVISTAAFSTDAVEPQAALKLAILLYAATHSQRQSDGKRIVESRESELWKHLGVEQVIPRSARAPRRTAAGAYCHLRTKQTSERQIAMNPASRGDAGAASKSLKLILFAVRGLAALVRRDG